MHGYSVIACLASKARVVRVSSSDLEAEIRQHRIVLGVLGGTTNENFDQQKLQTNQKNFANKNIYHKNDKRSKDLAKG